MMRGVVQMLSPVACLNCTSKQTSCLGNRNCGLN